MAESAGRPPLGEQPPTPGLLRRLNRWLARLGIGGATVVINLAAVGLAELLYVAMKLVTDTSERPATFADVAVVTVLVATPLTVYSQILIRRLGASRRSLRLMTQELVLARDRAEAADRAKTEFLANMSHELRTPLNAIIGFSDVMHNEVHGPIGNRRYQEYVQDIHDSGRHLLAVIEDVLDLAKIQAGGMVVEDASACDLHGAVAQVCRMLEPAAERGAVTLQVEIPEEAPRLLFSERMLRQVLLNIIGNAIKFTPSGGRVHVGAGFAPSGSYEIAIADTGIGMRPEEIGTALTPFGQVKSAYQRTHRGTGLGLPLAKAIMQLHDCHLAIDSTAGRGTTVRLTFPSARVVDEEPPAQRASA